MNSKSDVDQLLDAENLIKKATVVAKDIVEKASKTAVELAQSREKEREAENTRALTEALRDVFGEHEKTNRFVDVTRIPLICRSIIETNARLNKIEENLAWGVKIVLGTVILGVLALLFKK